MLSARQCELQLPLQPLSDVQAQVLDLESTLGELPLYDFQIDISQPGRVAANAFDDRPLLPGILLVEGETLVGFVSRRRFLECMSRPYGYELFYRRPLRCLYDFSRSETLICRRDTPIVTAARWSLQRPVESRYEPLVVEISSHVYRLLDVHQLLVAQSHIHELATQMLHEQTKTQMMQTEKMASLGQMVAGVAHEIRNPVNCVNGNISFLDNYFQDLMDLVAVYEGEWPQKPPQVVEMEADIEFDFIKDDLPNIIASMKVGADRLTKIVSSLHSFSHVGQGRKQPCDLHECIESTLLILKNRIKKVNFVKNYGQLPLVSCYSGQIGQVLVNLIGNALDALEEHQVPDPTVCIATETIASGEVAIRIGDNGPGIPTEIQNRIFETFFTTKPPGKGTGLGLAISHQIITENHEGQLNLRSRPGEGTEFEILLPYQDEA